MEKQFIFQNRRKLLKIPMDSIIFMENNRRKVVIHTTDGAFEYYGKLTEAMNQLDERFVHFHRSYVINIDHVVALKNKTIVLLGCGKIPLGQHSFSRVRNMLKNQIFS
ncbi:MAG: LytTR family transcriptional regulator [Eubacterium sp.]|nr:LytTR family transcriptional regulator [Candidatus Colimonas fimequi]